MLREVYHNSPEQVRSYLHEALLIVEELDPPDDLRAQLFVLAANWTAAKNILQPQLASGLAIPRG